MVGRVTREVYTGAELWDRPQLSRDRADLKAGRFQALVAYDNDRLSRDPIHFAIIAQECARAGVELILVNAPLDTSPEGMLIQYVKGYAAAIEREKIRERSIRGKHQLLRSGKILRSGTALYGYRYSADGTRREINEAEAAIVRQIFTWFVTDGVSMRQIQRRLNDQTIPTPTVGKRTPYQRRSLSGQRWNHASIRNMLREPAYKGETVLWRWQSINGRMEPRAEEEWVRLPEGTTPAIVSADLWDAAQRRLEDTGGRSIQRRNEVRPVLLRGLIFCAVCGRPMRHHVRKDGRRSYRCSSYEHGGYSCGAKSAPATDTIAVANRPRDAQGHFIPVDAGTRAKVEELPGVEPWVWANVAAVLRDPSIVTRELERRQAEGPDPVLESDLETAQRGLQRVERQQERLLQQFTQSEDDTFPWDLVKEHISRLEREKAQQRRVIDDLERRLAAQVQSQAQLASLHAYCERVANNLETFGFEERRLALEALQVRVIADGRNWSLSGSFPLDAAGHVTEDVVVETSQ